MRRGWHGESYRHYLASKGIVSRASSKRSQYFVSSRGLPSQYLQEEHQRRVLLGALVQKRDLLRDQYVRVRDSTTELEIMTPERLNSLTNEEAEAWLQKHEKAVAELGTIADRIQRIQGVIKEVEKPGYMKGKLKDYVSDEELYGEDNGFFAKKGFLKKDKWMFTIDDSQNKMDWLETSSKERLDEYVRKNITRKERGGWPEFKKAVVEEVAHPGDELDREWLRYNHVARKPEVLSEDPVQRAEQRGAALTARVLTQANVEPLIDHGRNSNARSIAGDLIFGRQDEEVRGDRK